MKLTYKGTYMKYRMGSKTKEIQGINALVLMTKLKKHDGKTPPCCKLN